MLPNKVINEIDHSGMVWFRHGLDQWQKVLLFSLRIRQTYNKQISRVTINITKIQEQKLLCSDTISRVHRIYLSQICIKLDLYWQIWLEQTALITYANNW